MCLADLYDHTPEQAASVAHVESLLAQHFARLEARSRAPFSPASASPSRDAPEVSPLNRAGAGEFIDQGEIA